MPAVAEAPLRKTIRHYNVPRQAHELTWSCYRRLPLLLDDDRRRIVSAAIRAACERLGYRVVAFVLMPEHVHLLVWSVPHEYDIASLLFAIKRPSSFRLRRRMEATSDPALASLTVRERPGKTAFRFWQEGPGYDRNLTGTETVWKSIRYIHRNPVERGLCARPEEWEWSSARQYADRHALVPAWLPVVAPPGVQPDPVLVPPRAV